MKKHLYFGFCEGKQLNDFHNFSAFYSTSVNFCNLVSYCISICCGQRFTGYRLFYTFLKLLMCEIKKIKKNKKYFISLIIT